MRRFKVGLLQGVFRSAFKETIPEVARVARPQAEMGPEDFRYNHGLLISPHYHPTGINTPEMSNRLALPVHPDRNHA